MISMEYCRESGSVEIDQTERQKNVTKRRFNSSGIEFQLNPSNHTNFNPQPEKICSGKQDIRQNFDPIVRVSPENKKPQQRDISDTITITNYRTEPRPPSHSTAPLVSGIASASMSRAMDIDTSNRFSVLDIPSSIKFNKLVESHDDLYPPDQGLVDGMDVDPNRPKGRDNEVCQLNREHAAGSRILPDSITSPHLSGENSSSFLIGPGCSGKSYGISDEQKTIIATRLKNEGSVSVDIVDQWCPGQWDYFNDLCTIMGLDPDYCIEDVESDDENGTAQFFAAQMKVGMPKVPLPTPTRPS
ncbi:hypothetical protein L1987_64030 [Smallanthus sonchifolius]|uniref:Uncharacterized protein n=1 Tax=Smallanthus sonchifolius TaxID=185202 RepID=A0ACB9CEY6_9ASTR|nr:hypothetical protein L1987_64030 [Smallanthus sonchifolius]